ncbi:hypothetical protein FIBSPDRAFT_656763, partial [Athelia psychrophila]
PPPHTSSPHLYLCILHPPRPWKGCGATIPTISACPGPATFAKSRERSTSRFHARTPLPPPFRLIPTKPRPP